MVSYYINLGNVFEQNFQDVVDTDQYFFNNDKLEISSAFRDINIDMVSSSPAETANASSPKSNQCETHELVCEDFSNLKAKIEQNQNKLEKKTSSKLFYLEPKISISLTYVNLETSLSSHSIPQLKGKNW